ncbi:mycofactocin precursor MftA [Nocardioides sp. zg-DK7169]|nr:mycofactocin precursor MftA [Nocardioides sp. zg-DK7169]NPC96086.1 mycofactocin precursor [Nocardioides sp. zg-DK7169]
MTPQASTDTADTTTAAPARTEEPLTAESLIEEVSIDGMCGVY